MNPFHKGIINGLVLEALAILFLITLCQGAWASWDQWNWNYYNWYPLVNSTPVIPGTGSGYVTSDGNNYITSDGNNYIPSGP